MAVYFLRNQEEGRGSEEEDLVAVVGASLMISAALNCEYLPQAIVC